MLTAVARMLGGGGRGGLRGGTGVKIKKGVPGKEGKGGQLIGREHLACMDRFGQKFMCF